MRDYIGLLGEHLRPQWRRVAALSVALLAGIALRLANPQIIGRIVDGAVEGAPMGNLLGQAGVFLAIALAIQVTSVASVYFGETVAWRSTNRLRLQLFRRCLSLDMGFHKEQTPGRLVERIDGDVLALANFFSAFTIQVLANVVLVIGILVLLYLENWRFGLPMTGFTFLTLLVALKVRAIVVPYWKRFRELSGTYFGFLGEQLAGREDLRSCGAEGFVMDRFHRMIRPLFWARFKAWMGGVIGLGSTSLLLFAFGIAIVYTIIVILWEREAITIGAAYVAFHYVFLLYAPLNQLRDQLADLQRADAGIARVREILGMISGISDRGAGRLPEGALSVRAAHLTFAYPTTDSIDAMPVLQDVGFHLDAGRALGLLGRTGSGKTTLARLLVRLYDAPPETLEVGGVPVDGIPLGALRTGVRLIPQEVQLFHASIRENVRLFDDSITDAIVDQVFETMGLSEWIESLPAGADTVIGAEGIGLSAGQSQLVALARAFLADPGLVILDEVSSRIDPATERLLEGALDHLLEGRTAIIIAHRLATIARSDDVLILEGGRVAEFGAREALARDPASRLSRLLTAEFGGGVT